ncbi:MAG TPA: enoyl-CoA hydratase-related protein [Candidatus Hydrogenedentes bacterium]|nr:enoyl-CoA hydratase-related protein [Candidatus Hydrogenedentota bacterium]
MTELVMLRKGPDTVAEITINRPRKRNALSIPVLRALSDAFEAANHDAALRVIVLRGSGPVFCAGLDLEEAIDSSTGHESAEQLARLLETVYYSPKVTIAAVHGAALAGGAGLMAACDLAVATIDSVFGFPEVRRGLVPGLIMVFVRRLLHERHLREMLLLGEIVSAERAVEIGLVSRCVPTDMFEEQIEMLVHLALQGGPEAVSKTKAWLDEVWHHPLTDDLQRALEIHMDARGSDEAAEGLRAFLEKRQPSWKKE